MPNGMGHQGDTGELMHLTLHAKLCCAGTYTHEGAIGVMKESKRATSPRAVFGNATRDTQSKVIEACAQKEGMHAAIKHHTPVLYMFELCVSL